MKNTVRSREQRIRRLRQKHCYQLWKVREGGNQAEYGPYTIIDDQTSIIAVSALELDDVEEWLANAI